MANCILCTTSLSFLNRPTFGQGKLSDGTEICFKCFSKNGSAGTPFKSMTSQQLLESIKSQQAKTSQVNEQIKNISLDGFSMFFGKKELDELPKILHQDEELIDLVAGNYNNRIGVLALTQKRLLFIDKGLMSLKVEDFPLSIIASIQYETGFGNGKITIMASGNNAVISNVIKGKVQAFVDKTRHQITEYNNAKSQPQQVIINQGIDVAEQLMKLADLKEKGILTDEEFQTQKQKLLNL